MKWIRLILFLTFSLFVCGCGQSPSSPNLIVPEEVSPAKQENIEDTPSSPTNVQILVEDDEQPPHENMVRSYLTNEWVDADVAETRPIAVMIPNEISAIPHYNLSKASVVYEANVEGRMTRLMAVYEDWKDLQKIGNIRSARSYYIYWAFEWDAVLVHFGGPYYINSLLEEESSQNIDGVSSDSAAFYRVKDRPDPHNVYTDGLLIAKQMEQKKYPLPYRGLTDQTHFQFAPKNDPNALTQYGKNAQNATYIDLSGCYPLTRCYFEFNENDGLYYRSQHLSGGPDGPHTDASGEQLVFKNILVQYTKQEVLDNKGYLVLQCHDDTRDGWFFTNGKGIHITWSKDSDYGATRYYDDNGDEISLNTGKTMICIVNEQDSFTFR